MKKLLLSTALLIMLGTWVNAQVEGNDPFIGLKAGVNYSALRLSGQNPGNYTAGWKTGFAGGLFGNIPLGKRLAIQPELLYSQMGGNIRRGPIFGDINQNLNYLSLPIMLKYFLGNDIRLLGGIQTDVLLNAKEKVGGTETNNIDDLNKGNFALTAGAEYWPLYNWGIGARYIHGLTEVSKGTNLVLKNTGVQATLSYRFGKKPVPYVAPLPPPVPSDRDNDGITDPNDKCPDVPGIAKYDGCPIPDTDKDGINDENDKCPTVPGLAKYQGCPIPDTDGDGINDELDKCPTVAGLAKYDGCPIPDTDNDGVNDEEDRCPTIPGVAENGGCPLIKFNASNVQFASGTSTLTSASKTELNKLVPIMNTQYPDIKVTIDGHTDNTGKAETNQKLSESRSASVKKYLVSKGISADRLTTSGYGADKPVEDNKTAAGKAKNRRVEFKISQ